MPAGGRRLSLMKPRARRSCTRCSKRDAEVVFDSLADSWCSGFVGLRCLTPWDGGLEVRWIYQHPTLESMLTELEPVLP